jgi:hypothetical protein
LHLFRFINAYGNGEASLDLASGISCDHPIV